jgi:3-dehydroquinate synthase
MTLEIKTGHGSYPVYIERGALRRAAELADAEGRIFIVTDSGIPAVWTDCLRQQFPDADVFVIPQGEGSKNLEVYKELVSDMLDCGISRRDTVIALGGGVAGDLAGFAAATYMRGLRFVNIPTTVLSQVDSSIGGKTGVDLEDTKNIIGAFWQPAAVIIDPDVLSTLPERQINAGLAEAVKAGIIRDPELFAIFESDGWKDDPEEIIYRALKVKKDIVEADERESGERKLLNFGHTFGHSYESYYGLGRYLHGECVAMGMMTVIDDPGLKERLRAVLEKLGLPTSCGADPDRIMELMRSDKKADHGSIDIVKADEPGKGYIQRTSLEELRGRL